GVHEHEYVTRRSVGACLTGPLLPEPVRRQARVIENYETWMGGRDVAGDQCCVVARVIIDCNHFQLWILRVEDRLEACPDVSSLVARGNDDCNARRHGWRVRRFCVERCGA